LLHRKETSYIPYCIISPSQELLIITNLPSPALPIFQHTLMHPSLAAKRNSSPLFGVHPIPQPYNTKLSHPTAASPPPLILLFRMFWESWWLNTPVPLTLTRAEVNWSRARLTENIF
jgi:hypothetical protein